MPDPRRLMPAVLDRQIESEEQDAFGHRHFAHALQSLVEDESHAPPFSIGLLGGWGTGKSSVKELYTRALADDSSSVDGKPPRSQRFKSITFNAWRFGGKDQDIKRALLRHVFLELGGDESSLYDSLYRNVTHTEKTYKPIKQQIKDHLLTWAAPVPAFLIAFLGLCLFVIAGLLWLPLDGSIAQGLFITAVTAIYGYLIKVMKPASVDPFRTITKVSLPSVSAEQYEDLLLKQLKTFASKRHVPYERLIVFVDDLDRLSAEEMVLGLDAVRTFMEIPADKLPKNLGLVFVISCDEGKVADALSRRRGNPEQPATVFNPTDARRYLDRIFQFRLEIPPPPRSDMRQFALMHLKKFPELLEEIAAKGSTIEQVVDRMIHVNVVDPRNALQIVNGFTQSWWLARKRELEAIGSERPGGLHEGAVTNYPVALGALSAARVSFPGFYRHLQLDPQLLHRLTNLMVKQTPLMQEPKETHYLLLEHYVDNDPETQKVRVKNSCKDLRQFLSSLVGVYWPASLQSLLLLSEDPITRNFGPLASGIYGHLVSGDTQGLLESLSARPDQRLSESEAQLLHDMVSDLHLQEEALKFNAMRVVADLIDRLPSRTLDLVLGILCNDLTTSPDLRSLFGVEKIGRVVAAANAIDQQHIAAALIDDLLTSEEPVKLKLESMQSPSLDEAIAMVESAAPIVLSVLRSHGLQQPSKDTFLRWLTVRTVSVAKKSFTIPFIRLEQWFNECEATLLPELGNEYVRQLGSELREYSSEGRSSSEFDLVRTAPRVEAVFNRLAISGEEGRADLWGHLAVFLGLPEEPLVNCALSALEQYAISATDEQLSACLETLSYRISDYVKHPLDYTAAIRLLVHLSATRFEELSLEALQGCAELAMNLSENPDLERDAIELFEKVVIRDEEGREHLVDSWIKRVPDDLPRDCIAALCRAYSALGSEHQTEFAELLNHAVTSEELNERYKNFYLDAANSIASEHWDEGPVHQHLNKLLPNLQTQAHNWDSYLSFLLPGLLIVFHHAAPNTLGPAIQALFVRAKQYNSFDRLHGSFAGHWPSEDDVPTGYDPQALFNEAAQLATMSPSLVGKGVLTSLDSMLGDSVVPTKLRDLLVETACLVWKENPSLAVDLLGSGADELTPSQLISLADSIDFSDDEEVQLLARVWKATAPLLAREDLVQTTQAILLKGKLGSKDEPERCLNLWCAELGTDTYEVLKRVMLAVDLTDEHRKRMLGQFVIQRAEPIPSKLPSLVLDLFKVPAIPLTWAAVEALRNDISRVFTSQGQRLGYAMQLLETLQHAASETAKGIMARWAKDLGTEAMLKDLDAALVSSEADLHIISSAFGKSRALDGLTRRWRSKQA